MLAKLRTHRFQFEELVKRDFKKKYKGTFLGMGWSMVMPLCTLAIMYVVFKHLFGRGIEHFATYLFCGNLVFSWFSESTNMGMRSIVANASIFTKVNVPKYLFLLARNVQTLINFALTLVVFLFFCWLDDVPITWRFLVLIYPIMTLLMFNIGMGMILSAFHVFFRDLDYLWGVALQLVMYGSAIFYPVAMLPERMQQAFAYNPIYRHIAFFREVTLQTSLPSASTFLVLAGWAVAVLLIGAWMYKRYNTRFLYYV